MKSVTGFVTILAAQVILGHAVFADDRTVEQSALAFQFSRFKVMVDADVEKLETTLADDLNYSYTTGWTKTKSGFC